MKKILLLNLILILLYIQQIQCYSETNTEIIQIWQETLEYGIPSEKVNVIKNIQQKKIEESYKLLNTIIENETNYTLVINAIDSCSNLNYTGANELIKNKLDSENPEIMISALRAVGELPIKGMNERLKEILLNEDYSKNIRLMYATIEALGKLKDESSLDLFYDIFKNSENQSIKESIILAIGEIESSSSIQFLIDQYYNFSNSNLIKLYCISALGFIGDEQGLETILDALQKDDEKSKIRAVRALSGIDTLRAKNSLIDCLSNESEKIRMEAINEIARQKITEALNHLFYIAKRDPQLTVKKKAAEAMTKIGGKAVINFLEANLIEEKKNELADMFVPFLPNLDKSAAFSILQKLYSNTTDVRKKTMILGSIIQIDDNIILNFLKQVLENNKDDEDSLKLKFSLLGEISKCKNLDSILLYKIGFNSDNKYVQAKAIYYSSFYEKSDKLASEYVNLLQNATDYDEIYLLLKTVEKLEIEINNEDLINKLVSHPDRTIKMKAAKIFK